MLCGKRPWKTTLDYESLGSRQCQAGHWRKLSETLGQRGGQSMQNFTGETHWLSLPWETAQWDSLATCSLCHDSPTISCMFVARCEEDSQLLRRAARCWNTIEGESFKTQKPTSASFTHDGVFFPLLCREVKERGIERRQSHGLAVYSEG